MVLYDTFIDELELLTAEKKVLPLEKSKLQEGSKNDILFTKDTAFELGGSQLPCVSALAVTGSKNFSNKSYLIGKDLPEIKEDVPFGKIVLVEMADISNDDQAFDFIKDLEQVKYKFFAKDFMIRASALNMREQIRIGKKALKNGISLADYGNKLIELYLAKENVKSVEIIFITDFDDYKTLYRITEKIKDTTSALNHILDNILFDCSSCNLKPICDEVEGMKELHQNRTPNKINTL